MNGFVLPVDADQTMSQTLQISAHDQLAELLVTAPGRFGRRMRTIAWSGPDMAPPRSLTVARMRDRMNRGGYQIDASLVASAIVDRVCAGDRTPTLH